MATLANGGTRVTPHLRQGGRRRAGLEAGAAAAAAVAGRRSTPEKLQALRDGLWLVVNGARHRRPGARSPGKDVCGQDRHGAGHLEPGPRARRGKTDKDLRDHGWFVFFAPRDNPEIAGVVFAEHGEHGATSRAPIAQARPRDVLREEGRPAAAAAADAPAAATPIADRDEPRRSRRPRSRDAAPQRPRRPTLTCSNDASIFHIDWALLAAHPRALRASASR